MAAAVLTVVVVAACGTGANIAGQTSAAPGPDGTITETGSGLLYPLARTWAAAYHRQFPGVSVTTASTGSGKGIALASAGKADIGASDAYLSSGDLVKNHALLNIPLAISAQTIIYNLPQLSQASHVNLDGAVLAGIYEGTITRWNDPAIAGLNRGLHLPAIPVVPVHRSDSSGDTFLFTSYLSQALAGGLGEAALANSAGRFTLPSAATVSAGAASFTSITPSNETISMIDGRSAGGYPIINYEYAIVAARQPDAAKAAMIRAFLTWVVTTGNAASYVDAVGFQPLPASVVSLGEQQIGRIGS